MQESFLHFIWRWRRFQAGDLKTTDGAPLEILHPGEWNHDAGPDFFNARIRIGDTVWAGNVEIHLRASEWQAHGHSSDPAYDNVVLHVVLQNDQPVLRADGQPIPCLSLDGRIPKNLLSTYRKLENKRSWIPCEEFFQQTPEFIRLNWLDRMLVERLEMKTEQIAQTLAATGNHWEETFYRLLARSFGLKLNSEPFEAVARSLPLSILTRHRHQRHQLEALLFGQAGMLEEDFQDKHPRLLAREYRFLRHKYELDPLPPGQWKFLRLRPANFPTIRLAQFAALQERSGQLLSQVLEAETAAELEHLFEVETDGYWLDHFVFDRPSPVRPKRLGKDFIRLLLTNTIIPFLFYWGRLKHRPELEQRALHLLEQLPAESNTILQEWHELGMDARNAYRSQALLHLKTHWCDAKSCLECAIGAAILK